MSTVVLVRHGHTELSTADHMCGTTDPPLCTTGWEMAEAVAVRAEGERWAALYASPLLRTQQTAEPVARRTGLPVALEPELREISYGEWDGRRLPDVRAADPERFRAWVERPGDVAPPGGETGRAVAARAVRAVEAVVARHPGERVMVVTHKTVIRLVICVMLGVDLNLYRVRIAAPVASFTTIEFGETGPLVACLGDTSHLPRRLREMA
jgi:probable phosphoglycerate mutase